MKIGLIDLSPIDFVATTPIERPLGGMQSGLSYLSIELAAAGHEVTLLSRTTTPGTFENVRCLAWTDGSALEKLRSLDAVISIYCDGRLLRELGISCPLVLWTGHNCDEPTVQKLASPDELAAWNAIVFKSQTQADEFHHKFNLSTVATHIIGNAAAPSVTAAPPRTDFFFLTGRAPKLIYASTPFRGLDILLQAFSTIRKHFPGCTLDVYSGMTVYQASTDHQYRDLYHACQTTPGIRYHNSVNQLQLTAAHQQADVLAFPSTYRETACITVMEAMASGSLVISTNLGAIPETSHGFGFLLPHTQSHPLNTEQLADRFAQLTIETLQSALRAPEPTQRHLEKQIEFARSTYHWSHRAQQWQHLLKDATTTPKSSTYRIDPQHNPEAQPSLTTLRAIRLKNGRSLFVDPSDRRGVTLADAGGDFNPPTLELWKSLLEEEAWTHIIDIGTNYGEMLANCDFPESAEIYAIEPNPKILPYLKLTLCGISDVRLHELAVTNRSGVARFLADSDWSGTSRITHQQPGTIQVRSTTLDQLFRLPLPQLRRAKLLLKIDIEGHEIDALKGASRLLEYSKNTTALIELTHLTPRQRNWLCQRFHPFGLQTSNRQLVALSSLDADYIEHTGIYSNDIVLRRKPTSFQLRSVPLYANEALSHVKRMLRTTFHRT